jgi:hypothetical protein
VAETTVKILLSCRFRSNKKSVPMLMEGMSRNERFFQVRISSVLRFISFCELFTDSPSYYCDSEQNRSRGIGGFTRFVSP